MNLLDMATPMTLEDHERSKREMQMRGLPLQDDAPGQAHDIDDLLRTAMEADDDIALESLEDPAVMAQRLDALQGIVWNQEARMRELQACLDEFRTIETERGSLTHRIKLLESSVDRLKRKAEQEPDRKATTHGLHMDAWRHRSIVEAREKAIEAMLEGGERFERMGHIHIREYGNDVLDYPPDGQDIEPPDFIVLNALPELLRRAFVERFAPVASLIREDATPHLTLAQFEDWRAFAATFA